MKNSRQLIPRVSLRIVFYFFLFVLIMISTFFFRIKKIVCLVEETSDELFCSQLNYLLEKSLFFINLEETDLHQTIQINDFGQVYLPVDVARKLPDTLIIKFIKEDPLYRLKYGDNTYVVNSHNYLTTDYNQFQLPEIDLSFSYERYIDDNKIAETLNLRLSRLVERLLKNNINYEQLYIDNDSSYLIFKGVKYLFIDNDKVDQIPHTIKLIHQDMAQIMISVPDNKEISEIDLRFKLPVVRFE